MTLFCVHGEDEDETPRKITFHQLILSRVQQEFEKKRRDETMVSIQYAIGQASSVSRDMFDWEPCMTTLFTLAGIQK